MSAFKTRFAEWEEWLEEEDDEELQHELLVVPPAPECEATTRWLKDGDRAAELAMETHLAPAFCAPCVVRILAAHGVARAIDFSRWRDLAEEEALDIEPPPGAPPWENRYHPGMRPTDLPWRLGWPGSLTQVGDRAGLTVKELERRIAAARTVVLQDELTLSGARRALTALPGGAAWWNAWMVNRAEGARPITELRPHLAAAAEKQAFTLSASLVNRGAIANCEVEIDVAEQLHGERWETLFHCRRGPRPREFVAARWRLSFEPADLDQALRRLRAADPKMPSQRALGLLRLLAPSRAFGALLDLLIPHRTGVFRGSDDRFARDLPGRLPGIATHESLAVTLKEPAQ